MRSSFRLNASVAAVAVATALAVAPLGAHTTTHTATHEVTRTSGPRTATSQAGPILGASVGIPQVGSAWNPGDTWYNTWAGNGDIYATSDDSHALNGSCDSNLDVNELTGSDPSELASPYANCMTSYGGIGSGGDYGDGRTWKSEGIISVDGTLYLAVARQVDGYGGYPDGFQPSDDASIVKSTDDGKTWSNSFGTTGSAGGAAPPYDKTTGQADAMFPGTEFATPQFIQYGEDDNPASTADDGSTYVYAISNNGFAYDGSSMILGRVLRSQIANLNASQWQFYTGGSGTSPDHSGTSTGDWSSNVSEATPILTATHELSQSGVQYVAALHEYIMTSFYYPFVASFDNTGTGKEGAASQSTWNFYQAPHPWGPWTQFFDEPSTACYFSCDQQSASQIGLYDPSLVSKFINMDGLSDVIFSSGDFNAPNRPNDYMYRLHEFPFTLNTTSSEVVDDSVAIPPGIGTWGSTFDAGGYYGDTYHVSSTAGASISYPFTGDSIAWVGSTNDNHGVADVSIDGGPATAVDTYSPAWVKQQVLYQSPTLPGGQHTITITVKATKPAGSSGTYQDLDAFIVGGSYSGPRSG
jgi:hypothetical protein